MSMRDHSIDDYGFLLEDEIMHLLAKAICDDFSEDDWEDDADYYEERVKDELDACYATEFTGEGYKIDDEGYDNPYESYSFDDDVIYYLQINHYPSICKAAYDSMDEIVEEFRERLREYLPYDFDYRPYIVHISGTYFG